MIIDYNKSQNITEEERLGSLRESVQRALDEIQQAIADVETPEKIGLVEKIAVVTKKTANAGQRAVYAQGLAEEAQSDAVRAREAADAAEQAADDAQTAADAAQEDADNASEYAARALGNLSTVQSVTETLNWITQHGTMALTTDVALDPTHVYFVQDAGGDYVVGGVAYAVVTEPDVADIGTYYELSIDESLNNYVATHLALTNAGLSVLNDNSSGSMLLASDGVTIKNANGTIIGQYGEGARVGALNSQHISIENGQINFWAGDEDDAENLVAYVSGQELHIPRVVVVQSLQMGNWVWDATIENHLSLNWRGD